MVNSLGFSDYLSQCTLKKNGGQQHAKVIKKINYQLKRKINAILKVLIGLRIVEVNSISFHSRFHSFSMSNIFSSYFKANREKEDDIQKLEDKKLRIMDKKQKLIQLNNRFRLLIKLVEIRKKSNCRDIQLLDDGFVVTHHLALLNENVKSDKISSISEDSELKFKMGCFFVFIAENKTKEINFQRTSSNLIIKSEQQMVIKESFEVLEQVLNPAGKISDV